LYTASARLLATWARGKIKCRFHEVSLENEEFFKFRKGNAMDQLDKLFKQAAKDTGRDLVVKELKVTPLPKERKRHYGMKTVFRDAANTVKARRQAEKVLKRERVRAWNGSREEWHARYKLECRLALLDELAPDRHCPFCGEVKLRSAQWVLYADEGSVLGKRAPKSVDGFALKSPEQALALLQKRRCACRSCHGRLFHAR
jgi:hypothetical protein